MKFRPRTRRSGAATIEYALFLSLVAGGIVLAADTVSYAMRGSLDEAALAVQSGVALRHIPIEDLRTDTDLVSAFLAPDSNQRVRTFQFASVAGSLFCGALVWYGLYCRRTMRGGPAASGFTDELNEFPPEMTQEACFIKRQQILRVLSADVTALLENRLEVRHLVSRRLVIAAPETSREAVQALMEEHSLRHLLVCDAAGQLVGVVSDRDVRSRSGNCAGQLMTKELIVVEPHALVHPAITLLINKKISCLPVVSHGVPLGILTSTDLMMALQCSMQLLQKLASGSLDATAERTCKTISSLAD